MTDREKLVELLYGHSIDTEEDAEYVAEYLIANGVTVQGYGYKVESGISKTGFMCTACHSDVDRDAVYCKYCGAKMVPDPPKEE